ncbi:hypothetical protein QBC46DRAFT_340949 [Diplogelasinospora grovesii]|uniref:Uncharacterized protein n=1 Tax=Diplogelasinospora grovesii TaxID=303347 RepID=A0AAN6S597_9PEZI|nr:hypothetical protein QBC46DRAFT_340949 [Diplogelasinospora grovesii]
MKCLGIPIDHRLRGLIRGAKAIKSTEEDAGHVQILHDFGTALEYEDGRSYLPICDLGFRIEMARPESKGSIVVALLRPHSKQVYSEGFVSGTRDEVYNNIMESTLPSGPDPLTLNEQTPWLRNKQPRELL